MVYSVRMAKNYQGVIYFRNVVTFYGTLNVVIKTPKKYSLSCADS